MAVPFRIRLEDTSYEEAMTSPAPITSGDVIIVRGARYLVHRIEHDVDARGDAQVVAIVRPL